MNGYPRFGWVDILRFQHYIVNFDIKDSARVEQFARQLDEVGETLLFMPRCYS